MNNLDKAKTKGFYAKSLGLYIFSKIFRHVENSIVDDIQISEEKWKMNFTIED